MNASGLNRRVQLLKRTLVKQASGERLETWADAGTVWAEKLFLTSRDVAREQGTKGEAEAKFRIRYRSDIDTNMRVISDGRTFSVNSLEEIGNREGWFLMVREVTPDA